MILDEYFKQLQEDENDKIDINSLPADYVLCNEIGDDDYEKNEIAIVDYIIDNYIPDSLTYEDCTVIVGVRPGFYAYSNGDPGEPDEDIEGEADWDFNTAEAWQADAYQYTLDFLEEYWKGGPFTVKDLKSIDPKVVEKFVYDLFEDDAQEDAWDNYDYTEDYYDNAPEPWDD